MDWFEGLGREKDGWIILGKIFNFLKPPLIVVGGPVVVYFYSRVSYKLREPSYKLKESSFYSNTQTILKKPGESFLITKEAEIGTY